MWHNSRLIQPRATFRWLILNKSQKNIVWRSVWIRNDFFLDPAPKLSGWLKSGSGSYSPGHSELGQGSGSGADQKVPDLQNCSEVGILSQGRVERDALRSWESDPELAKGLSLLPEGPLEGVQVERRCRGLLRALRTLIGNELVRVFSVCLVSVCLFICLSACLFTWLSAYLLVCLLAFLLVCLSPVSLSAYLLVCLSASRLVLFILSCLSVSLFCLSVCLFFCLFFSLFEFVCLSCFFFLSVCLHVCLFAHLFVFLPVCLFVRLPVFLFFCLFVCLFDCLSVCLPICMPVCQSASIHE